jgi:hypothetical protein
MADSEPLYQYIEFCRNPKTLWGKLQEGRWDWLGVHPKGQFVLGRPRLRGRIIASHSMKVIRHHVEEGQHGVRWLEWSGTPDVEPNTDWLADEQAARDRFDEVVQHYENPNRTPVLAKVWLIQNTITVEERFIAQTPPPNYQ